MTVRWAQPAVVAVALLPAAWLVFGALTDGLGANPIDKITDETGTWTLRLLVASLAVTPLRRLTGWNALIRVRRTLGLLAFCYGTLHFSTYVILDQFFDLGAIVADVMKRPYITAGFTGFVLMIPLALTSTTAAIQRLGGRNWQRLHRLVYVSAVAGVVHYLWLVKADRTRPLRYAAILAVLLGARVVWTALRRSSRAPVGRRA